MYTLGMGFCELDTPEVITEGAEGAVRVLMRSRMGGAASWHISFTPQAAEQAGALLCNVARAIMDAEEEAQIAELDADYVQAIAKTLLEQGVQERAARLRDWLISGRAMTPVATYAWTPADDKYELPDGEEGNG